MKNTDKNLYLGVDIGASNTKFIIISGKNIKTFEKFHLSTPHNKRKLVDFIVAQIKSLEIKYRTKFAGVGVAFAGIINSSGTTILHSPNIRELDNFPLLRKLSVALDRRYILNNDANVFAFAEALAGAAKGVSRVAGITLGTGMGGGLVVNQVLEKGAHGGSAEIGHTIINPGGIKCSCGGWGHFEEHLSARAIRRHGVKTQEELAQRASAGNKKAKAGFADMVAYLGYALANIVNFWDPEIIVIGGGIAEDADLLLKKAAQAAKKDIVSPEARAALKVKKAKLGEYAGAMGAALLAIKK